MSLAQCFYVLHHLQNGRPDLAQLVAMMPPAIFAAHDALMIAAYNAGRGD
jgi:hypothetical protein